jgi:predicted metal-dependent phosphoesterase TrpH
LRFVDLHAHTTASDGTLAPGALVEAAARAGLAALAVTDHDQLAGLPEAREAGARLGVEVVAGVELSLAHAGRDVHLLGLLLDDAEPRLAGRLAGLREARARRAEAIVERLRGLGVGLALADVRAQAAAGTALGRPHVARALVEKGIAASLPEAFDRFLAEGRPAFVPKARLSAREGIGLVHAAGGLAVLAHPALLGDFEPVVRDLAGLGLDGVEVLHPRNAPPDRAKLRALARELDLAESGGSDYHGENKPEVELGMERVPAAVLDGLKEAKGRR